MKDKQNHLQQLNPIMGAPVAIQLLLTYLILPPSDYDSEVFTGGLIAGSSVSQLDDTFPVFLSTEGLINVAVSTSTPVLGDCVDHIVISSDYVHYGHSQRSSWMTLFQFSL
ncbi:hypothetical protein ATANTOWER_029894 [Ataeniobius toweri]|uniref:Uncharacterized protein n=1 Tax=Ataeniobius toweri TaxID=208326 RepID=A0ABU7C104_9TELE|nr:hypothetical protein [Ataeniobius toweri]